MIPSDVTVNVVLKDIGAVAQRDAVQSQGIGQNANAVGGADSTNSQTQTATISQNAVASNTKDITVTPPKETKGPIERFTVSVNVDNMVASATGSVGQGQGGANAVSEDGDTVEISRDAIQAEVDNEATQEIPRDDLNLAVDPEAETKVLDPRALRHRPDSEGSVVPPIVGPPPKAVTDSREIVETPKSETPKSETLTDGEAPVQEAAPKEAVTDSRKVLGAPAKEPMEETESTDTAAGDVDESNSADETDATEGGDEVDATSPETPEASEADATPDESSDDGSPVNPDDEVPPSVKTPTNPVESPKNNHTTPPSDSAPPDAPIASPKDDPTKSKADEGTKEFNRSEEFAFDFGSPAGIFKAAFEKTFKNLELTSPNGGQDRLEVRGTDLHDKVIGKSGSTDKVKTNLVA